MSARTTMLLALFAGLALIVSGVTVPFWMAAPGADEMTTVARLNANQTLYVVYALAVLASCALFLPVVVLLGARLYVIRPGGALVGATLLAFGLVLEATATMGGLARLTITPAAAAGDAQALLLMRTLTLQYLTVDFSGVGLIYIAGLILAALLWWLHRISSVLILASVLFLALGAFGGALLPGLDLVLLAASIVAFGLAYISLGVAAAGLGPDIGLRR